MKSKQTASKRHC